MPVHGNVRYRISHRLELAKRCSLWWNRVEVKNIFSRLESLERSINDL